ncbi:hypothetical protein [Rathayibacter sp. Leaf299]|uniref:hypothetical protein n=1 Tax=Rathayibacter sp. Leaf299 TaxID=1736328 RepID=UPI0012FA6E01|nr:hypothetical protein [Rathayibacter sp. Leaf299]
MTSRTGSLPDPTRSDRVYFASDRKFARAFANFMDASAPGATRPLRGALYRVEPIGEIHEDPDFRGRGVSWCARSAVILECEELEVVMSEGEANAVIGPHMTWDDGSAMYAENGIVLRSREMRTAGVPALALTRYGRWPYIERVLQDLNARIARGEFTSGR